jgi:outer membrane protein OmpA-like peptidoglycan-associated protein
MTKFIISAAIIALSGCAKPVALNEVPTEQIDPQTARMAQLVQQLQLADLNRRGIDTPTDFGGLHIGLTQFAASQGRDVSMAPADGLNTINQYLTSEGAKVLQGQMSSDEVASALAAYANHFPVAAPVAQAVEPVRAVPQSSQAPVLVASQLAPVYFATNSSVLNLQARSLLLDNAAAIVAAERVHITVHGFADERGSWEHNEALSTRRAMAVGDALIDFGVAAEQITVAGKGEVTGPQDQARRVSFTIDRAVASR